MLVLQEPSSRYSEYLVGSIAFAPDGGTLATGAGFVERGGGRSQGEVVLWDLATGQPRARPVTCRNFARCVAFSPDGGTLAAGLGDRTVRIWDTATLQNVVVLGRQTRSIASLAFSPDSRRLATCSFDFFGQHKGGEAMLWDLTTRELRASLPTAEGISSVAFAPDGQTVALGIGKTVGLWDLTADRLREKLPARAGVKAIATSPDGRTLAAAVGWEIALWDLPSGRPRAALKGHKQAVHCLAIAPGGEVLASGGADETVRLWDLASGTERTCYNWEVGSVRSLAFSPDGTAAAVGGSGRNVLVLWDYAL